MCVVIAADRVVRRILASGNRYGCAVNCASCGSRYGCRRNAQKKERKKKHDSNLSAADNIFTVCRGTSRRQQDLQVNVSCYYYYYYYYYYSYINFFFP